MQLSIEITDEVGAALTAKAEARGLSAEQLAGELLEQDVVTSSSPRKHISQVIRERMRNVPAEVLAQLPADGATQHDHYIYGLPKRDI